MSAVSGVTAATKEPVRTTWSSSKPLMLAVVCAVSALAYLVADKISISKHRPPVLAHVAPPPHSIAVLPFVNMSGDKEQEYFSEGLTEELLNSLSRINQLQVAARTSSFSFRSEHPDIATIAHKLNVAAVLEGSVRRSVNTVRISVQLVNGTTGFHVWSETYDRDLGDMLKLQTEIATAVASALKIPLLGGDVAKIEAGGTRNAGAFDAYLRAEKENYTYTNNKEAQAAIDSYTQAIALDRGFALAYAARSLARCNFAKNRSTGETARDSLDAAKADAHEALALAPELGEAHLALAFIYETTLEFSPASEEFQRALALAPGNARVLTRYGLFAVLMGAGESGLSAVQHAVLLDPLNSELQEKLGYSLFLLRRYSESIAAYQNARALAPRDPNIQISMAFSYYMLGSYEMTRSLCEFEPETDQNYICLALTYRKLGRRADAETMLTKLRVLLGDDGAYLYVGTYAQWGDVAEALQWLEAAARRHRPWLERVKMDSILDPLREEPRFQTVIRELKFPD